MSRCYVCKSGQASHRPQHDHIAIAHISVSCFLWIPLRPRNVRHRCSKRQHAPCGCLLWTRHSDSHSMYVSIFFFSCPTLFSPSTSAFRCTRPSAATACVVQQPPLPPSLQANSFYALHAMIWSPRRLLCTQKAQPVALACFGVTHAVSDSSGDIAANPLPTFPQTFCVQGHRTCKRVGYFYIDQWSRLVCHPSRLGFSTLLYTTAS
jgi:hypothetical protein